MGKCKGFGFYIFIVSLLVMVNFTDRIEAVAKSYGDCPIRVKLSKNSSN